MPPKYIKKLKGIESKEEFKGTREYIIKYFAFCYNSVCQVHEKVKYSISYWLKELKLDMFKGTENKD